MQKCNESKGRRCPGFELVERDPFCHIVEID